MGPVRRDRRRGKPSVKAGNVRLVHIRDFSAGQRIFADDPPDKVRDIGGSAWLVAHANVGLKILLHQGANCRGQAPFLFLTGRIAACRNLRRPKPRDVARLIRGEGAMLADHPPSGSCQSGQRRHGT